MKTKIISLLGILMMLLAGFLIAKADFWPFVGNSFSWIGNNLVNTNQGRIEQGDPVIGMIKMNGSRYQVAIEGTGPTRVLTGAAWFGIGSQDDKFNDFTDQGDLPSLGWILFNQGTPSNNCFGAGDCHAATWYQKPGVSAGSFEGYISGWAKLGIGPNGDLTPYPETWLHFKAPANPNNCGGNQYHVCVDVNGRMEGYAWSAGANETAIDGNPGFGLIKFSKNYAVVVPASYTPQSITCKSQFESGNNCKNFGVFTGEFRFKAVYQGTNDPGNMLRWFCKDGDPTQAGDKATCVYKDTGIYQPKLEFWSLSENSWKACESNAKVEVTPEPKCSVLVNPSGASASNIEKFSAKTTIKDNESAIAMLKPECITAEKINWTVSGGQVAGSSGVSNEIVKVEPSSTGTMTINASAKDKATGKTYDCGSATVTVKSSSESGVRIR